MDVENLPVIREAGLLERYYIARRVLNMDSCVMVAATYTSDAGVLDKPTLLLALEKVVQRHGALGMQISRADTRHPVYVRLPEIDLTKTVVFARDQPRTLQQAMEAHLQRTFELNTTSPLWRVEVLEDNTVIFAYLHAIADGQSGRAFHRALLEALNESSQPEAARAAPDIVSVPTDTVPLQPAEALTDLSVSFLTACRAILDLFIPDSWTAHASAWTGNPVAKTPTLATRVRLLSLAPDETARILARCRAHNATLTAFLHTLALRVLSALIAADPALAHTYRTVASAIPVSLRRFAGISADEFCNAISVYESLHPLLAPTDADAFPWDAAARFTVELHAGLARTREQMGLFKFLFGNIEGWVRGKMGRKRGHGVELSNVGPFPGPAAAAAEATEAEAWHIAAVQFAQPCHVFGAALIIGLVGTPLGGLGISVTWDEDSVDAAFAEAFVEGFRQGLQDHAGKQ
ncbi:alcohol acetyltransferase [Amylocystis lapponica]|nr:alcohol acetyltransferase [Amylocystis lapponica]